MKKLILMMGVLVGMIGCSENEDVFEYQKLNSGESINYYQKELAEPNDTIRIDNPTEPNGGVGMMTHRQQELKTAQRKKNKMTV